MLTNQTTDLTLLPLNEASQWISNTLNKQITKANISYLLSKSKIKKYKINNRTYVSKTELLNYYNTLTTQTKQKWINKYGNNIAWHLAFDHIKESETTKHVHRLHPYKGKFIPQLVEYFLDEHTDPFKPTPYFKKGDIILDPFAGSGTTLVQCNELGLHAIGIDVAKFNCIITNAKLQTYDLNTLKNHLNTISNLLSNHYYENQLDHLENTLSNLLIDYNKKYTTLKTYNEQLQLYKNLIEDYISIVKSYHISSPKPSDKFIEKWYFSNTIKEISIVANYINNLPNDPIKSIIMLILSRTMRSTRATPHFNLTTLKDPITSPYFCKKHNKFCKPTISIFKHWTTYSKDTIQRLIEFQKLKTNTHQICLNHDSRTINLLEQLEKTHPPLYHLVKTQKINGIFTSPPYIGLINYHDEHNYAYELFNLEKNIHQEIGINKSLNKQTITQYINDISTTLLNLKPYLTHDHHIFLIANDNLNLFQTIANNANLTIINTYTRPVLHHAEAHQEPYTETIFYLKNKN